MLISLIYFEGFIPAKYFQKISLLKSIKKNNPIKIPKEKLKNI
jgi:hypothetical protein